MGHGGQYFFTDNRAHTPWGDTRPDYGRSEVRDYIKDTVRMWLNEYRLDGPRFDGTKCIRTIDGGGDIESGYKLLSELTEMVRNTSPWKIMIAEDFGGDFPTASTSNGGNGFDSQWDGAFVHPVRDAIVPMDDGSRNLQAVADAITHKYQHSATNRVIYTESHDEVASGHARVPEEIWPGHAGSWAARKRSTLGAAIMLNSPGIPLVFEGQELNEDGYFRDDDPIDWQKGYWFPGIVTMYRDLIDLRRNFNNNTRGLRGDGVNVFHMDWNNKVIAYQRWQNGGPGDDVVVIANFSQNSYKDYAIGFPSFGMWHVRMNTDAKTYSPDFGATSMFDTDATGPGRDGMPNSGRLQVPPYSVVILSQ